jgi:hypothetical protein
MLLFQTPQGWGDAGRSLGQAQGREPEAPDGWADIEENAPPLSKPPFSNMTGAIPAKRLKPWLRQELDIPEFLRRRGD